MILVLFSLLYPYVFILSTSRGHGIQKVGGLILRFFTAKAPTFHRKVGALINLLLFSIFYFVWINNQATKPLSFLLFFRRKSVQNGIILSKGIPNEENRITQVCGASRRNQHMEIS